MRTGFTILLLTIGLAGPCANGAAGEVQAFVVEAAPLRGLVGQFSGRVEMMPWSRFALGLVYGQHASTGERAGFIDRSATTAVEGLIYPLGQMRWPIFVGLGLARESAILGRQASRASRTWARTTSDQLYDQWTNEDIHVSVQQSFGYRLLAADVFTVSLRFTRDEVLMTRSRARADNVIGEQSLQTRGRPLVRQSVAVHAGVYLP